MFCDQLRRNISEWLPIRSKITKWWLHLEIVYVWSLIWPFLLIQKHRPFWYVEIILIHFSCQKSYPLQVLPGDETPLLIDPDFFFIYGLLWYSCVNSLWPSDAIWRYITDWVNSGSGNGLSPDGTKPLPDQHWYIISKVLWLTSEVIICGSLDIFLAQPCFGVAFGLKDRQRSKIETVLRNFQNPCFKRDIHV